MATAPTNKTSPKKKNFIQVLIDARNSIPGIGKNKEGIKGRYTYATLDKLLSVIIPALSEQGLFLTQSCESKKTLRTKKTTTIKKEPDGSEVTTITEEEIPEYAVTVSTTLLWAGDNLPSGYEVVKQHNAGSTYWSPSGSPQDLGTCETYGKRYGVLAILGIFPSEATDLADDDGQLIEDMKATGVSHTDLVSEMANLESKLENFQSSMRPVYKDWKENKEVKPVPEKVLDNKATSRIENALGLDQPELDEIPDGIY